MAQSFPQCVDTVIIGNGPSALILSYILHGHIPYYIGGHQDALLNSKLSKNPDLLRLTPDLYAHFLSSLRYSTQALPINTLLDTLIRPNADTEINPKSCIEWRYEPEKAISHVVIGETGAGGQWAEKSVSPSDDIGTLSYAELLSLPGYSYSEHLEQIGHQGQCDFVRPTRAEAAEYFKVYPQAVGISDAIYTSVTVDNVSRTSDGFLIGSHGISCNHLVLASGIFAKNIPPPPLLTPLASLDCASDPLLVIGSGFSAADIIISTPPGRKIIHLFRWAPDIRPSPLHGCHHTAYPEYATIYRQMKIAVNASNKKSLARTPLMPRKSNPFFSSRDWASTYEGLPNAEIESVSLSPDSGSATVIIRLESGTTITRTIGGLKYVVGRRGSLSYLSPELLIEILGHSATTTDFSSPALISGRTLRSKAESSLEVAKNVFIIGSLAGDSLVRHAVGGCVYAAGRIMGSIPSTFSSVSSPAHDHTQDQPCSLTSSRCSTPVSAPPSNGYFTRQISPVQSGKQSPAIPANGHEDLHLDRRKLFRAIEVAEQENRVWGESGWWAGGFMGARGEDR
ncbi:hypothetical protein GQ43DRAFT_386923 [Delitschia confertaspora ATCC 74209]|uniref:FAD/NAD(P)-binding domain-containing protein n=1 Tax=Delitschia confertaspora ATCC 74209 TaxID=1513339 RepID=A0A9P4JUZ0_9PLEO|nr:hypothetical protein GQ43DRAFT_386923 [Delitschia confertaspora ATCC 74209]